MFHNTGRGTFAWYTESISTATNTLGVGNLDVKLYYGIKQTSETIDYSNPVEKDTDLFALADYEQWEPGTKKIVYLKIVNEGSLPAKFKLRVDMLGQAFGINTEDKPIRLSEYLRFKTTSFKENADDIKNLTADGNAKTLENTRYISKKLSLDAKNDEKYIAFALWLPKTCLK